MTNNREDEMSEIRNSAGEVVFVGSSDAECVRWWNESGRAGDRLYDAPDNGTLQHSELMSEVADLLDLDD